ncbi:MAG: carbamoyltransferase [Phycisphaeraceae bacterium]|nr:carbamoyltransferase [Phycisphaeraceae bacterium]|tara:strand:- start:1102 stop:2832 length:1731 start_codon:yes stop_codon:yes gene_type:complete
MHILGFDCYGHDAAAAIMRDGKLLGLVEEERFLRQKHVASFPIHSIRWCCDHVGIKPAELDHIVYYWDPRAARLARAWFLLRHLPKSIGLIKSRGDKEASMLRLRKTLAKQLQLDGRTVIHFAPHHLCHAASAFLTSAFDKAAILSIDAAGEWDCAWMGYGDGIDMKCLRREHFPNSLGLVYGAVTEFLGYRFASGEGKVMGLAPYGDPGRFIQQFRDMIKTTPDGRYGVDMSYFNYQYHGRSNWFSKKFFDTFGPPRKPASELTDHYKDVSAALQMRTEEVGLYMAKWLRQQTGLNKVCLAGGVCLNSVMNGRILREGVFDEVVVQPAANDAGTALGGCFWLWNTVMRKPRKYIFEHAYLGPAWSDEQYERAVRQEIKSKHQVEIEKVKDAPSLAASMLSDGKIIGWFQGRMEMGPRALGNRSILADPRVGKMKDLLNERVKFRESFRPFAPSILEEKIGQWFDCGYPSPYMILVYNVLLEKRKYIPAVTHVDGTGRVHSVNRKHNPRYYGLLTEFERLTGVPIVLNTSFNIRGQPVVNKPEQAIECFVNTGIDVLFLGDYVLSKQVVSTAKDRN